jgi:hypothetical protein
MAELEETVPTFSGPSQIRSKKVLDYFLTNSVLEMHRHLRKLDATFLTSLCG